MKCRRLAFIAVIGFALINVAYADDWTSTRHDPANTAASKESLRPPFSRVFAVAGATNEPLLVAGNTLFYTRKRPGGLRDLVAYNLGTKKPIWTVANVTQPGAVSPALAMVFTVVRTSVKPTSVSRLGANLWPCAIAGVSIRTGKTLWTYAIGEHPVYPAISPLTTQGDTVYLVNIPYCVPGDSCPPGTILALDALKGTLKGKYEWNTVWRDQVGTVLGPPALSPDGKVMAVPIGYQSEPGRFAGQVWLMKTGAGLNDGVAVAIGDPSRAEWTNVAHSAGVAWPLIAGKRLLTQGPEDVTRAWELSGAPTLCWRSASTTGRGQCLASGSTAILYHSGRKRLYSARVADGKEVWSRTMTATGLAVSTGNVVLICGREPHPVKGPATGRMDVSDAVLYAVDATTGKVLWTYRKADVSFNTPMVAAGRVFVSDSDGNIHIFQPSR